jgi:hypothetical protein
MVSYYLIIVGLFVMKSLRILLCGGDGPALKKKARALAEEGMTVEISTQVIDTLCFSKQEWDFLMIDLDGLSSFLRSLLPAVSRNFPNLPIVGLATNETGEMNLMQLGYGLELDDCLFGTPRPEDLIVRFPHVAAKYLCDTGSLRQPDTQPLAG